MRTILAPKSCREVFGADIEGDRCTTQCIMFTLPIILSLSRKHVTTSRRSAHLTPQSETTPSDQKVASPPHEGGVLRGDLHGREQSRVC